jgi:hypothetical protein
MQPHLLDSRCADSQGSHPVCGPLFFSYCSLLKLPYSCRRPAALSATVHGIRECWGVYWIQ